MPGAASQESAPEGVFDLALALALGGAAAKQAVGIVQNVLTETVQAPEEDKKKVDPTLCLMAMLGLNQAPQTQEQPDLQAGPAELLKAGEAQAGKANGQPAPLPGQAQGLPDAGAAKAAVQTEVQTTPEVMEKFPIKQDGKSGEAKAASPVDKTAEPASEQAVLLKAETQGKATMEGADPGRESSSQTRQGTQENKGNAHATVQAMQQAAAAEKTVPAFRAQGPQTVKEAAPVQDSPEPGAAAQVARATLEAVKDGVSEYRIRLKPEGLGHVEVTLKASGKTLYLDLRTDNQTARDLILDKAADLKNDLSAQDYQVGSLNVQVGGGGQNEAGSFTPSGEYAGSSPRAGAQERQTPQPEQPPMTALRSFPARSGILNYRI